MCHRKQNVMGKIWPAFSFITTPQASMTKNRVTALVNNKQNKFTLPAQYNNIQTEPKNAATVVRKQL
jgi:hypothetical protein